MAPLLLSSELRGAGHGLGDRRRRDDLLLARGHVPDGDLALGPLARPDDHDRAYPGLVGPGYLPAEPAYLDRHARSPARPAQLPGDVAGRAGQVVGHRDDRDVGLGPGLRQQAVRLEEVEQGDVAHAEPDAGDALAGEETDKIVVAPAAEQRTVVGRVEVEDLEDRGRVVLEGPDDERVEGHQIPGV